MMHSETCPKCGSDDYEINDYSDDFTGCGGEQWWSCTCNKCGCNFDMTKVYRLTNVIVEEVSAS